MDIGPTWVEISLGRLSKNYGLLQAAASEAELLAVIKAGAYGHGVMYCAPALARAGAGWFGVTSVGEGSAVRAAVPGAEILVMSGLWAREAPAVLEHRLVPQIWEPYHFELLREAAVQKGQSVAVHLEVDTGMSRQGVPVAELDRLLSEHARAPIEIEGALTHFSAPEMLLRDDTAKQMDAFAEALSILAAHGVRLKYVHAGNSANVLSHHETSRLAALAEGAGARLMMRPGLALYGYPVRFDPARLEPAQPDAELKPVLSWKARIASLRTVEAGTGAGYDSVFRARRTTRLALVLVGYADGLNRLLSNPVPTTQSAMLVRGQRAPIAGRISMDQTILDVTDVSGASIGDEVVILGEQGDERITAYEHADLCGTIPYEILCNISARVPRLPAN